MYIDFAQVKSDHPIEEVADRLGLVLKKEGGQLRGECPVAESDNPRALSITPSKGKFFCFSCQTGGDVISLVQHIKGIGAKEAAEWITGPVPEENKTPERPKPSEGFQPLDYLQPEHDAVEALGISPLDAGEIGIGYAPRGYHRGLVAIPIRLEDGRLVGYVGVSECKVPKDWRY